MTRVLLDGSVHDGDQVIEAIHRHRPDIVLMYVRMARQDGITTMAFFSAMAGAPKVIMLTTFDHDHDMLRAVHAGAAGFQLRCLSPRSPSGSATSCAASPGR